MGRALRVLGGILLVGALALAGFLAEAHLEVRSVAPPLPGGDAFAALLDSGVDSGAGPVRLRYVNTATQGKSGHPAFVLEWADGRAFLVDAGMDREGAIAFGRLIQRSFGGEPIQPHGAVPAQLGAAVSRIEGIAFTHLHGDHTAGLASLCAGRRVELPVYQTAFQAEKLNFWTRRGHDDIAAAPCARRELLEGGPLHAIPGFPGVVAYAAGGHTPGSTVYVARVAGRSWVLAGDITNRREDLLRNRPKRWVYSWLVVPEATGRLAQLRPWLAGLDLQPEVSVVVSHDLAALAASGIEPWRAPVP